MDRGFDPVAPIIHDWTYEPMVYDLLEPEGATYRYQAENNRGTAISSVLGVVVMVQPKENEPKGSLLCRRQTPIELLSSSGHDMRPLQATLPLTVLDRSWRMAVDPHGFRGARGLCLPSSCVASRA